MKSDACMSARMCARSLRIHVERGLRKLKLGVVVARQAGRQLASVLPARGAAAAAAVERRDVQVVEATLERDAAHPHPIALHSHRKPASVAGARGHSAVSSAISNSINQERDLNSVDCTYWYTRVPLSK